jgi:hypothetical protein
MSKSLSFNEYQLLSAYLDGRCSTREINRVESLLASDIDFKNTYSEFVRCKKMLKAVPQVRAPHNFTLSAALAPQKPQRFFLAPALNYAALVTAVLFVFLFAGARLLPSITTRQAEAPQAMMMSASDSNAATTPTPMPMINWGLYGGIGGKGGGAEGSGLGGGPSVASVPNETMPLATQTTSESQATSVPAAESSKLILGIPDKSAQGKQLSPEGTPIANTPVAVNWLLVGEVGLAVLAVVFALVSLILRKRH